MWVYYVLPRKDMRTWSHGPGPETERSDSGQQRPARRRRHRWKLRVSTALLTCPLLLHSRPGHYLFSTHLALGSGGRTIRKSQPSPPCLSQLGLPTKVPHTRGLNNRDLFPRSGLGWKSKIDLNLINSPYSLIHSFYMCLIYLNLTFVLSELPIRIPNCILSSILEEK